MHTDLESRNKAVIRSYIEAVVNTGDTTNISHYISPAYVEVYENKVYELGLEGVAEHIRGVRKTYPDLELTIERQIAEGEWVSTCYTMTGTHAGEWMGIKPTEQKISVTGVNVDRVVDGKIVEHGGAANLLDSLLRIGAVRIVGSDEKPD